MRIYPAIDLKSGRCVRLLKGRAEDETVYNDDPADQARAWERAGAEVIHVVDLDGAFSGAPANMESVRSILGAVSIPIELGGGLRTAEAVSAVLEAGVWRAVIGTSALREPELVKALCAEHGERVAVGIDSRRGMVSVQGWTEDSRLRDIELGRELAAAGCRSFIFTDIDRDGVLTGPNLPAVSEFIASVPAEVVASGGVAVLDDVRALASMEEPPEGVIIGKALYEKVFTLEEAIEAAGSPAR